MPESVPAADAALPQPDVAAPSQPDGAAPPQPDVAALPPGADVPLAPPAAGPEIDLSALGLFLQADPVVKGVMVLLLLASIWCWAVILEKAARLVKLRREAAAFEKAARAGAFSAKGALASDLLETAAAEWRTPPTPGIPETRGERRARIDQAMRAVAGDALRRAERGLTVLATTGSAAPFIGLFGTVWGIMHSFTGIAQSQDTSLAVVAPGIAEALFATAMGLVAAIPAVIAYNKLAGEFSRLSQRFGAEIARLAGELSKRGSGPAAVASAAE